MGALPLVFAERIALTAAAGAATVCATVATYCFFHQSTKKRHGALKRTAELDAELEQESTSMPYLNPLVGNAF